MDHNEKPSHGAVFIDAEFRPAAAGRTQQVRDKATGAQLGTAADADADDVDVAVTGAVLAQRSWSATSYTERAAVLRRVSDALGSASGLRELIQRETGSIGGKADYEISAAISELDAAIGLAGQPLGEVLRTGNPGRESLSERIPVGVVGVITPWNFPLVLGMRVIAPALALGNTVVLKPSPETPLSGGLAIAELFRDAGAPPGIFQVVPGREEVGRRLVEHPDVAMVHFTGSTQVGRQIARSAGELLKKVSLELGGNNALVVLDDADVATAGTIGAWSSFHYQGQTCISAGRHIVDKAVADGYIADMVGRAEAITVGDPTNDGVGLGPMINQTQLARAERLLADAVAGGARVVAGGTADEPFFRPTVVVDVDPKSTLWTEEIFAPIVAIQVADGVEDAVRIANDSEYGLVASVVGADVARAEHVARQLRCGMVHVNDATPQDEASAPFGGLGISGLGGRSGGTANIEEFTERRWLTVNHAPVDYPY